MEIIPPATGLPRAFMVFALALACAQAAVFGVSLAFPDFDMPSSTGLIVVMVSAMVSGQAFAKTTMRILSGAERLRFALGAVVITVLVSATLIVAAFAYYKVPLTLDFLAYAITGSMDGAALIKDWLWVIAAVSMALTFLVSWIFVGMGAKTMLKGLQKQAAKAR